MTYYSEEESSDFTVRREDEFDKITRHQDFRDKDDEYIYTGLLEKMPVIPFGDYLKRYLYTKAGMKEVYGGKQYEEIPIREYQTAVCDSFTEFGTPASFVATTSKLSALSKNWLTQRTVNRRVVFLLGFGLKMSVGEVNIALTKWLQERRINPKNAFEVICWYCYSHGYGYPKFESLYHRWCETDPQALIIQPSWSPETIAARMTVDSIHDDSSLLMYTGWLKLNEKNMMRSITSEQYFNEMYEEAQRLIAAGKTQDEEKNTERKVRLLWNRLYNNDRLPDYEKQRMVNALRENRKTYTADDIRESDFEQIICAAIPKDRHGNLSPAKTSSLNAQFNGFRFSRQHIGELRKGTTEITRFDLLTLKFFIFSQRLNDYSNEKKRFYSFVEECNSMLEACSMGELYYQNPYECFLLMCMLADDPLGTYADVMERSYQKEAFPL